MSQEHKRCVAVLKKQLKCDKENGDNNTVYNYKVICRSKLEYLYITEYIHFYISNN